MVLGTEIEQLKATVSLENIAGNISCEYNTKKTPPFGLDTNIAGKHENLSIKT